MTATAASVAVLVTQLTATAVKPAAPFHIEIEQEGRAVPVENHEVTLRRAPFDIVVVLPDKSGVAVRASSRPELFERARRGEPLGEVFIPAQAGPEELFNPGRELWVDVPDIQHVWQYDSKDPEHRFNEVTRADGLYRCRRSVGALGLGKKAKPIEKWKEPALYLVFLAGPASKDWMRTLETHRDFLKISFEAPPPRARAAAARPKESPTEAAVSLLFARDILTAEQYLPESFKRQLLRLESAKRLEVLQNLLLVPGLEKAGAKVTQRRRKGKPEVSFELPDTGRSFEVALEKERIDGAEATLEGTVRRKGQPDEPVFVRMVLEEGRWRLAGIRGRSEPDPSSPAGIWARLDDPDLAGKLQAQERAANERLVVMEIRVLLSGQAAFAALNGGYFGPPECLQAPRRCLPGYAGVEMVQPPYPWASPRNGYKRTFHPGPRPTKQEIRKARASDLSLKSYALVAVPVEAGKTGNRSFCGDSWGRICVTADGSPPVVRQGLCASPCEELE